jgi:hypothetical protein
MVLSTYMTSCGRSSDPMIGQARLNGGIFAHGASGPPTVRFRRIRLLGATDGCWPEFCLMGPADGNFAMGFWS